VITLTAVARCIGRCDWSAAGDPASADKAAERHTRTTAHPTVTLARPATMTTAGSPPAAAPTEE
jgi:hypothetical protein